MQKAGFRYEGTSLESDRNNQGICDAANYAILARDYFEYSPLVLAVALPKPNDVYFSESAGICLPCMKSGFTQTHRVPDYFTIHYYYPIIEDGVLLKDKVYLERKLRGNNYLL